MISVKFIVIKIKKNEVSTKLLFSTYQANTNIHDAKDQLHYFHGQLDISIIINCSIFNLYKIRFKI